MSCERVTILTPRASSFFRAVILFSLAVLIGGYAAASDTDAIVGQAAGQSINGDTSEDTKQVEICRVVVSRSNIFEGQNADLGLPVATEVVTSNINRFHKTTRESVILREAGVAPGDTLSVQGIADIERRLRQLGIFASVTAKLITNDGCIELHLGTRDNFSLVGGASGSYLGGVGNVGFKTGEKNFFGTGNKLLLSMSRSSSGAFSGSVEFNDLHFFEKNWRAKYRVGRTNEGDFYGFSLTDAFKSLNDKRAWTIGAERVDADIKYYTGGKTVVAIPEDKVAIAGQHIWRSAFNNSYIRRGLVTRFTQSDYSDALFAESNTLTIDTPDDRTRIYIGGLLARDTTDRFMKVQGLDTLNFVQDISIGSTAEFQLGANFIEDQDSSGSATRRTDPALSVLLRKSGQVGNHALLKLTLAGSASFEEGGARPWSSTTSLKAFYTKFQNNTLAMNMDYTTGEDGSGLPVQLTLGEDNGLRGYEVRQFEGQQRWRMNLETRYRPGWKLGIVDVGVVGFFDAGWAQVKGLPSASVRRSVGGGLRLASNAILGRLVVRVDLAAPLDALDGGSSSPSLSVAVGQVFRF